MPNEEKAEATEQQPQTPSPEKSEDKWDQLMAKLDDITGMLRKACEGGKPETPPAADTEQTAPDTQQTQEA